MSVMISKPKMSSPQEKIYEIDDALVTLDKNLIELDKSIEDLHTRLIRILRDEPIGYGDANKVTSTLTTPLGKQINSYNNSLEVSILKIKTLCERIEMGF